MSSNDNRTEKATPKKRKEAVEKGDIAKSTELNSAAVLVAALLSFGLMGSTLLDRQLTFMKHIIGHSSRIDITAESLPGIMGLSGQVAVMILAPLLLAVLVAGVGTSLLQTGLVLATKAIEPKLNKISPLSGVKRLFSLRSIVESIKGFLKISIVGVIAWSVLDNYQDSYRKLAHETTASILDFVFSVIFELSWKVAIAIVIVAILDYAYQRWEYERKLKMSKQEVKDESKQTEGDPKVKGRVRTRQQEMARLRMMDNVRDATAVIANPIHIAVALKYDPKSNLDAPIVVAKGKRKIAEKIKELAREHRIPIIENRPLARSLFEHSEIGMEIPVEHYQAVAEILSWIYQSGANGEQPRNWNMNDG